MKKWNSETNHSYGMHGGRTIENQTKNPKQSKMVPQIPHMIAQPRGVNFEEY